MKQIIIGLALLMGAHAASAKQILTRLPAQAYAAISTIKPDTLIPIVRKEWFPKRAQTLCLALAMYHEARGETPADQIAVAQVIYNRIAHTNATICGTVWADRGSQFQWVRRGARAIAPREIGVWQSLQVIAVAFTRSRPADITKGAKFFYNPELCHPAWAASGHVTARLKHVFVKISD